MQTTLLYFATRSYRRASRGSKLVERKLDMNGKHPQAITLPSNPVPGRWHARRISRTTLYEARNIWDKWSDAKISGNE